MWLIGPRARWSGQSGSYGKSSGSVQFKAAFTILTIACALFASAHLASAAEQPVRIVALGDSLTAGYGLAAEHSFPAKLERALKNKGYAVEIDNAGVSGETASGGLSRLDWSVPDGTDAVIVELGANDALRGIPPAVTREALDAILRRLRERRIPVLLAGMRAPPNLGADYARAFDAIFPALAREYDAVFYPFFLDGVAAERRLNLTDGVHPSAEGIDVIVASILPKAEKLVRRVQNGRGS